MSGRIIVLTGDTKYGAGEHFLEELATAFEERERPVTRLDVRPAEAVSRLQGRSPTLESSSTCSGTWPRIIRRGAATGWSCPWITPVRCA